MYIPRTPRFICHRLFHLLVKAPAARLVLNHNGMAWPTRWLVISGQHCVQALGTGAYQRRKHRASRCMAVVGFSMTYYAPRHLTVVVETCSKLISMHQSTWPSPFQLRWIILTFCGVSLGHWLTFSQGNLKIWTWSQRVKRNFKRRSHLTVSVWGQNLEDSVNGGDAVSS